MTNWGTGTPRREFLHVDDMADACLHLLEHYDGPEQVNVGSGTRRHDHGRSPRRRVRRRLHRRDRSGTPAKPDGTPQKLLDVSKLARTGWTFKLSLHEGIQRTVAWYRDHAGALRE